MPTAAAQVILAPNQCGIPNMSRIHQDHLIESVADALQFISYYHPKDFVDAVHAAYEREESKPAKDAMA